MSTHDAELLSTEPPCSGHSSARTVLRAKIPATSNRTAASGATAMAREPVRRTGIHCGADGWVSARWRERRRRMLVRMSQGAQAQCFADAVAPVRSRLRCYLLSLGSLARTGGTGSRGGDTSVTSEPVRAHLTRGVHSQRSCASPFQCGVPLIRGIAREELTGVGIAVIRAAYAAFGMT
jgi:hypothetical protein